MARLETRKNKRFVSSTSTKSTKSPTQEDRGPTSLYTNVLLWSSLDHVESLVDSINIDLRKSNIRVTIKDLQAWDSESRKILCGVNNGLCVVGVQQLLSHLLKEMEKKLCRHGKLDTLEWYDCPLPEFHISVRSIRSLKLPDDPKEKKRLTFDSFPWGSKLAYFVEAGNDAWKRLGPLLQLIVDSNILSKAFGPSAFIMDVPDTNPKIGKVRAHHEYGRISMGYNVATTIIDCNEVQLYDYEVKVTMEEVEVLDDKGNPTGQTTRPKPPYSRTTLRKELQRIRFNNDQIFHTAIMVCKGPETGTSNVVVTYDTQDPLYKEKFKFAQNTINNLACFMFHWLQKCGYSTSTRTRLMRSFHEDKNLMAEHSSWDDNTLSVTPHFPVRRDTYLVENARYDPLLRKELRSHSAPTSNVLVMADGMRKNLLNAIGYDKTIRGQDVNSTISGVSKHTGDGASSCGSTVNSENTANRFIRTREYAKQLAEAKAHQAEQTLLIQQLQSQMETMIQQHAETQQGSPHLSGSGASRPTDPGSGEALQGT